MGTSTGRLGDQVAGRSRDQIMGRSWDVRGTSHKQVFLNSNFKHIGLTLTLVKTMAISIHRPCRRTYNFKNWRRKESYDKKSYDLKWQGVHKTFLHYHFHESGKNPQEYINNILFTT